MTELPALAITNSLANSEIPSSDYTMAYPLAMILRIIAALLLIMYWSSCAADTVAFAKLPLMGLVPA